MKYEILLFDLGGVLFNFSNQTTQAIFDVAGMSVKELLHYFTASTTVKDFETGISSSQEFGENVVRDLELSLSVTEFLELFRNWFGGLYDGTEALLTVLSHRYRLGCFSNNNELWGIGVREKLGMLDDYFLSHEIGMRKPDLPAYEYVIQQLDIEPDRILFFDDFEQNVMAAQKVGMNAFLTKGLPEVREQLNLLGVLQTGG